MINWSIEKQDLELKYSWKIARNSSDQKTNIFVTALQNKISGIGEAAPNIRYGESPESLIREFSLFVDAVPDVLEDQQELENLLFKLPLSNSLRFSISSSFAHLKCREQKIYPWKYLNLSEPHGAETSYTIPIMDPGKLSSFIEENNLKRFKSLKLKVNDELAKDLTISLRKITNQDIRVDGNECWTDPGKVLDFLSAVKSSNIQFLEQPFPAELDLEYKELKAKSPVKLFLDESVTDMPDLKKLKDQCHGINMKLMKAGGYLNGIRILREARNLGLETMIGCMVETSLGIWSGLNISSLADYTDLDGAFLLQKEPFNLIKEKTGTLFPGYL